MLRPSQAHVLKGNSFDVTNKDHQVAPRIGACIENYKIASMHHYLFELCLTYKIVFYVECMY